MAKHGLLKRVAAGVVMLAMFVAMGAAEAQHKRMPVRTEPIPDTESGRPAASAEEPANPSMMIYGPPTPPLGAPPSPPAPVPEPAAIPAPVATPAPAAVPPPVPIAIPVPPPAPPPASVAAPAPVVVPPPLPAPVAIPAPIPAPVAPVAAPAPVVAPTPAPAPVATPAPMVKPAPVAAPAPPLAPVVAAIAPAPSPTAPKLDAETVEQIFSCLAPGLPQDWKRTWVVVTAGAAAAPKFYVTTSFRDEDAEEFVPCNAQEIARRIISLGDALPPDQRRWKSARLKIDSEGEFELKYDYAK